MRNYRLYANSLVLVTVIFVVLSCSARLRHTLLTKLFDGVPDYNFSTQDSTALEIAMGTKGQDTIQNLGSVDAQIDNNLFKSIHPPFEENDCASCHDSRSMGKLHLDQPQLCYTCHEDLAKEKDYTHGPAAGYCTSCHSPHNSKIKKLLFSSGQDLCLSCHEETMVMKNLVHEKIGGKDCTECHDPHKSNTRFLLREGICTTCHEKFSEKYAQVHGPVAGEYCGKCHAGHLSNKKFQLVKSDQELCLQCHEPSEVKATHDPDKVKSDQGLCLHCHEPSGVKATHDHDQDKVNKVNCTACHNPHGGNEQYMVRSK